MTKKTRIQLWSVIAVLIFCVFWAVELMVVAVNTGAFGRDPLERIANPSEARRKNAMWKEVGP